MSNDQSLMDRIESPEFSEIPEVAMKKIDIIQKQFYLAEVEQRKFRSIGFDLNTSDCGWNSIG